MLDNSPLTMRLARWLLSALGTLPLALNACLPDAISFVDSGSGGSGANEQGGMSGDAAAEGGESTGGSATGGSNGGSNGATGGTAIGGGGGGRGGAGSGGAAAGSGGVCGKCGCDGAETDADMDGVFDCMDMCVGFNDADCEALRNALVHRYSFNGTGTAVTDSKGTAHGTALGVNAALTGSGTIVLAGGMAPASDPNKQYVGLPAGLLMGLTDATLEVWLTWPNANPSNYQRIFDFGTTATASSGGYMLLTPQISSNGGCRAALSEDGSTGETSGRGAQANGPVISAGSHHFVVIVDDTGNTVSLYVDGVLGSTVGFTGTIAATLGPNNWLGRSNFTTDPYLGGTLDEFRIYGVALTAAQLRTSGAAGPDATFF